MAEYDKLIKDIVDSVDIILAKYMTPNVKSDEEMVDRLDSHLEDRLMRVIQEFDPAAIFVNEHSKHSSMLDVKSFWMVDALDGAYNMARGLSTSAVSVSRVSGSQRVFALVYQPFTKEIYLGIDGKAYCNNIQIYSNEQRDLYKSLIAVESNPENKDLLIQTLPILCKLRYQCLDVRMTGCFNLNLAHIAAGRLDAAYLIGVRSMEVSAGIQLVRNSGGHVQVISSLGKDSVILAASSDVLYRKILSIIREQKNKEANAKIR